MVNSPDIQRAIDLRDTAHDAALTLGVALGVYDAGTGNNGAVIRPDLGMVLIYASTATHALESRANGRGQYRHRINRDVFTSAADIPASLRKLGAIARAVEESDALTLRALETRHSADLAGIAANEYRDAETRALARAALDALIPA